MTDRDSHKGDEDSTVLIPVNAAEAEDLPVTLVKTLAPLHIVVLGYYLVPNQAAPEQVRSNHKEEATAAIDDAVSQFTDRGAEVESVVVFTHDKDETIDHVADEYDVDAVLTPGEYVEELSRVLVPMRGDENLEKIISFSTDLLRQSDVTATLYNVAESDGDASHGELLLRGARDRLAENGIDPDRVNWQVDRGDSPGDKIVTTAQEYDVLIVGESEPSLRERILGRITGHVVDRVEKPVFVVRDR
ncbi:universal stress protein [Halorubrum sp. CGM5_25_10-8B]|uniref:universal stress protein n=1 Tax=Halorubrum sp. CGM5_25_10-8B TaxID=2518115 RepID=UPI0010F75C91|nr:universal stress protein [Halorubrum sp. CGM5_25_10-8B]TKX37015.1 universal stress protein [Halorubrum sp. CGM5_25_10-8B]